jgi:hypothetical protein
MTNLIVNKKKELASSFFLFTYVLFFLFLIAFIVDNFALNRLVFVV